MSAAGRAPKLYDLIGDIHGHADELVALLAKMGYRETGGAWRHPERTAVFVGDFIDRGPKILETLKIVRPMLEERAGARRSRQPRVERLRLPSRATLTTDGSTCASTRGRTASQHQETLAQIKSGALRRELEFLRKLPFRLALGL